MDTLDGSHGPSFIYLPAVYLDDCQVVCSLGSYRFGREEHYQVEVEFLGDYAHAHAGLHLEPYGPPKLPDMPPNTDAEQSEA